MNVLGCICDDITGATDLAGALVSRGVPTTQVFGVPDDDLAPSDSAVVIALKTRTMPVAQARVQVRQALDWLQARGVRHVFDKYCSTFDSTPVGNIGPIADELLDGLGQDFTVHCPSYPANGRTVYQGHLFVGPLLLNESSMREHPLTPMTDAHLVRVLRPQTTAEVGLLPLSTVRSGEEVIRAEMQRLRARGVTHLIADAIDDTDVDVLAAAASGLSLWAGGAPFGAALGSRLIPQAEGDSFPVVPSGPSAILVGSASEATVRQVERFQRRHPMLRLAPEHLQAQPGAVAAALDWARTELDGGPVMIAADTRPDAVSRAQRALGRERAAEVVENAMGMLAVGLVEMGVRRLVVAGGETSGAVAAALGVAVVRIGPEICVGVPWTVAEKHNLALAFKSGNFGGDDFFTDAFERLTEGEWKRGS